MHNAWSLLKTTWAFTLMTFYSLVNFWCNLFMHTFLLYIGSRNTFFDVDFIYDGDTLRITCIFFNTTTTNGKRSCTVMFGKDLSTCRNLSHSLKREQSIANTLRISIDLRLPIFSIKQNICLVIRASDIDEAVEIERRLTVASGILSKYH